MQGFIEFIKKLLLAIFGGGENQKKSADKIKAVALPYKAKAYYFSRAENSFYQVLRSVLGDDYVIMAKARLADIITVNTKDGRQQAFNRIKSKHIDFLLCSSDVFRPVLAIELDDKSHHRQSRIDRDKFVDDALSAAGLGILHVPVQQAYNVNELKKLILSSIIE